MSTWLCIAPMLRSPSSPCRFRPPNELERRENGNIVVDIDQETSTHVKINSSTSSSSDAAGGFTFDRVFGMQSSQSEIFEYGVRSIVEDVMAGYNGTVFAYGQTGSGKTFTMMVRLRSLPSSACFVFFFET